MLMVVFGAGASYDSFPSLPPLPANRGTHADRPPLAAELFSERAEFNNVLRNYPDCLTIVPYLRRAGAYVEEELSVLQNEAERYPARHRQLAAVRYYLQEMLWGCEQRWKHFTYGVSNYRTFIDQIAHWTGPEEQVCLVTFNYDRLLEAAMPAAGLNIRQLPDYISDQKFKLIKLHGSINWGRWVSGPLDGIDQLSSRDVAYAMIHRADQLDISTNFCISEESPISKDRKHALFPAIAIPVQNKTDFECPDTHFKVLLECIPNVTKLIIIGWRGVENHFKKLLAERLNRTIPTLIVAGNAESANETLTNLSSSGIKTTDKLEGHGFSQFVDRRAGSNFLQQ